MSIYDEIANKRKQFNDNLATIESLRATNARLKADILALQQTAKNGEHIKAILTGNKIADIQHGIRCFICAKPSDVQCHVCKFGYCDNHTNKHQAEHTALWVNVDIDRRYISKTDEEKIAELQRKIKEIQNRHVS